MQVCVETYGCAANQGDAAMVQGVLEQQGHTVVDSPGQAEVVVLMTCIVIDTTQQRMLHRLRILQSQGKRVVVGGCLPAALPALTRQVAPDAPVLPPRSIHTVADLLAGRKGPGGEADKARLPRRMGLRLSIPIADGCRQACSYCITRLARGWLTSYSEEGLVAAAGEAVRRGCRELRLTAQDTAAYGLDTGASLASLVGHISDLEGDFRIRVGMMHPATAGQRLEEVVRVLSLPKVYRFLHLPLQSGSDAVLRDMRRRHTVAQFMEVVESVRSRLPQVSLATDVIVGFPGETQEQFMDTCRVLEELKPDVVNVTRFSARPRTPAKTLPGRVSTRVAKQRSRLMSEVADRVTLARHAGLVGTTVRALLLERLGDVVLGKTDTYCSLHVPEGPLGGVVEARVTDAAPTHVMGEVIG
ncbi:MAG: tRNA (N(6)-L-threonylcarbamoyladenosine(37)-C(2))-methylthiotransferase [Thermoplasmatota archaeon]